MAIVNTKISGLGWRHSLQNVVCAALVFLGFLMYANILHEANNLPEPWFDDAFMYIRYAENVNAGNGYCWNKEESPLFGCTDIAHVYLIAEAKKLLPTLSYESITIWLPVINYGILVLLLFSFFFRFCLVVYARKRFFIAALISVGLLLNPVLFYHLFTGMDTVLSFTANTVLIMAMLVLERKKTMPFALLAAVAAYLSWWVRLDNIFYALVFPALFFIFFLWQEKKLLLTYWFSFAIFVLADFFAKQLVFGEILPLPFYVKSSGFFTGYMGLADWNPISYLFLFIGGCWLWLILLFLFCKRQHAPMLAVFLVPLLFTLIYFFDAVQMMGSAARFYVPSIPFLLFPALMVVIKNSTAFQFQKVHWVRLGVALSFFTLCFLLEEGASEKFSHLFLRNEMPHLYASQIRKETVFPVYTEGGYDFFDFCAKLPEGTLVAASENGRLAAYNPHLRILDLCGLHNSYFAHHGFSASYLFKKRPAVIQLAHYNFTKINFDIVNHPNFKSDYDFYPNLYGYGVAIRRNETAVKKFFDAEVKVAYGLK